MRKSIWINNFHYQNAHKLKVGQSIDLIPEPDNEYDENAIALVATVGLFRKKVLVGYIPKGSAKQKNGKQMPKGTVLRIKANNDYGDWQFNLGMTEA